MDILDDMGESKCSAKVLFIYFSKVNYTFKQRFTYYWKKYCL